MGSNFEKNIDIYSSRDRIRQQIVDMAKEYAKLDGFQFNKDSYLSYLINVLSVLDTNLLYYVSSVYKEQFLTRAVQKDSVLNHAYALGYKNVTSTPAKISVLMDFSDYKSKSNDVVTLFGRYDNSNISESIENFGSNDDYVYKVYADNGAVFSLESTVRIYFNESGVNAVEKDLFTTLFSNDGLPVPIGVENIPYRKYGSDDNRQVQVFLDFVQIRDSVSRFTVPTLLPNEFFTKEVKINLGENESISNVSIMSFSGDRGVYETWKYVDSLYGLGSSVAAFTYKENSDGITLDFGNDIIGKQPKTGLNMVVVAGITRGADGNAVSGAVRSSSPILSATNSNLKSLNVRVINKSPAISGTNSPSIDEIRNLALLNVSSGKRVVSENDYKNISGIIKDLPVRNVIQVLKRSDIQSNLVSLFGELFYDDHVIPTRNTNFEIDFSDTPSSINPGDSKIVKSGNIIKIYRNNETVIDGETYYTMFDMEVDTETLESRIYHYFTGDVVGISSAQILAYNLDETATKYLHDEMNIRYLAPTYLHGELNSDRTYKMYFYANAAKFRSESFDQTFSLDNIYCNVSYNISGEYKTITDIKGSQLKPGDTTILFQSDQMVFNIDELKNVNDVFLKVRLYFKDSEGNQQILSEFTTSARVRRDVSQLLYSFIDQKTISEAEYEADQEEIIKIETPEQNTTIYNLGYGANANGSTFLLKKEIEDGITTAESRILMKFDTSDLYGKEIIDTTLDLYFNEPVEKQFLSVHKLTQSWNVGDSESFTDEMPFDGGIAYEDDSTWTYSSYSESSPKYWIKPGAIETDIPVNILNLEEYFKTDTEVYVVNNEIIFNEDYSDENFNNLMKKWYQYRNDTTGDKNDGIIIRYNKSNELPAVFRFYSKSCDEYDSNLADSLDSEENTLTFKPFLKVYYRRRVNGTLTTYVKVFRCIKNTNIYTNLSDRANANGQHLYIGTDESGVEIRALLEFEPFDTLPSDAEILGGSVTMHLDDFRVGSNYNQTGSDFIQVGDFEMFDLRQEWSVSESSNFTYYMEVGGLPSSGDSNWVFTKYPENQLDPDTTGEYWVKRGGTFQSQSSNDNINLVYTETLNNNGDNIYKVSIFGDSSQNSSKLYNDVLSWVAGESENNGWLLRLINQNNSKEYTLHSMSSALEQYRPKLKITYKNPVMETDDDNNVYTDTYVVYDVPVIKKEYYEGLADRSVFENYVLDKTSLVDINSYKMMCDNVNLKFSNTTGFGTNMKYNKPTKPPVNKINPTYGEITTGVQVGDRYAFHGKNTSYKTLNTLYDESGVIITCSGINTVGSTQIPKWVESKLIINDMFINTDDNKMKIFNGTAILDPVFEIPVKVDIEIKRIKSSPYSDNTIMENVKENLIQKLSPKFGYGRGLYVSEISKIVQETPGVEYCSIKSPKHDIFFDDIYESISKEDLIGYTPELVYLDKNDIKITMVNR